jgi:hypothetical protein
MDTTEFEIILSNTTFELNKIIKDKGVFTGAKQFEQTVRNVLTSFGLKVNLDPPAQQFPDILLGEYGIEVKFTENDTWRSIANSISEGARDEAVRYIYLVFGKMGGIPEVKWGKYEDCVIHVRTSHVPRFEVEIGSEKRISLFQQFGITYEAFSKLTIDKKMEYVRAYARGRLKSGEHFWWLDNKEEQDHSLPLEVKIYMNLSQEEKRKLRAEAALLCPQIVKHSRSKDKYSDAVSYMLTYRGVLCPQARDLFSAGSVAMRDGVRGGNYIKRALIDIEDEMRLAAESLEDDLFIEYWGVKIAKEDRIKTWLEMADKYAKDWKPSQELFLVKK